MKSPILSWDAPTLYSDGTPFAPGVLKEFRVYFGTQPRSYSTGSYYTVSAPTTTVRIYDILSAGTGTYYFSVTAVDVMDMESGPSNEVSTFIH